MRKYLTVVAVLVSVLVVTVAVNLFNSWQRQRQQQEHDKAEAAAMRVHFQQVNDATRAFKERIVLRGQQLERSGVKRKDLGKALSGEEAQAHKELDQKLQRLQADERRQ